MAIALVCASCGHQINVRDDLSGRRVRCPKCASVLLVEAKPGTAQAPPPMPIPSVPAPPVSVPSAEPKRRPAGPFSCVVKFGMRTGLLAVTTESLWFGAMSEEDGEDVARQLKSGTEPGELFDTKALRIEFGGVTEVGFNEHHKSIDVQVKDGDDTTTHSFVFADQDLRDDAYDAIRAVLRDWKHVRRELTPVQATFKPLLAFGAAIGITALLVYLAWAVNEPDQGGRARTGRGRLVGLLVAYSFGWIGPVATGLLGLAVMVGIVIWMVLRVRTPPIEVSLKPPAD